MGSLCATMSAAVEGSPRALVSTPPPAAVPPARFPVLPPDESVDVPPVYCAAPVETPALCWPSPVVLPPVDDGSVDPIVVDGAFVVVVVVGPTGSQWSIVPIDFIAAAVAGAPGPGSLLLTIVRSLPVQFDLTS
jgi:hypothetical protein